MKVIHNYNSVTTDDPTILFTQVDEEDSVIGPISRQYCHNETLRPWHRSIHCYIFFKDGSLILSQRSLSKDTAPGEWTVSMGGHVRYGSSYLDQAKKCSFSNCLSTSLTQVDTVKVDYGSEREIIAIFMGIADTFPKVDAKQVLQYKLFNVEDLIYDFSCGKFDLSGGSRDTFKHIIKTGSLKKYFAEHFVDNLILSNKSGSVS